MLRLSLAMNTGFDYLMCNLSLQDCIELAEKLQEVRKARGKKPRHFGEQG